MEAFAKRQGKEMDSLRFLYDGIRIQADQTPEDLDMEDNDIIERTVNKLVAAPAVAARTCTSRGGTFDDPDRRSKNAFNIVMKAIKERNTTLHHQRSGGYRQDHPDQIYH
jgi:hypothetical protein